MRFAAGIAVRVACLLLVVSPAWATTSTTEEFSPGEFSASLDSQFPFWMGARAQVLATRHFAISAGVGTTPGSYASALGSTIASLSGNELLDDLLKGMLSHNSSLNLRLEYREAPRRGWGFGVGLNYVRGKGDLSISTLLSVLANQTYPAIGAYLHSTSTLFIGQVHGFYEFPLSEKVGFKVSLGILEILGAGITLSSNFPAFDNTVIADTLYRATERPLKNALFQYGISPFLGTELRFTF